MMYVSFDQAIERVRKAGAPLETEDIVWLRECCSDWIMPVLEEGDLSKLKPLQVHIQAIQRLLKDIRSKRESLLQAPQMPQGSSEEVAQAQQEHFINLWLRLPKLEAIQRVLESSLQQNLAELDDIRRAQELVS